MVVPISNSSTATAKWGVETHKITRREVVTGEQAALGCRGAAETRELWTKNLKGPFWWELGRQECIE